MGCSTSVPVTPKDPPQGSKPGYTPGEVQSEPTHVASVVIIQKWFRRHRAYFELQRRAAWHIFQKIEYKNEEEQVKLSNFFATALKHSSDLQDLTGPKLEAVPLAPAMNVASELESALSAHPLLDLSIDGARAMLKQCESSQFPDWEKCMSILASAYKRLQQLPNITRVSTSLTTQICIVGDLHGQLTDLLIIFEKNGLPSESNPYLFNGDLVDRGTCGLEVTLVVLYFFLLYPGSVHINRGNHEDYLMNKRYGFEKEVLLKYGSHGGLVMRAFSAVFTLLPLATVINGKVLVVHAGIDEELDLVRLEKINRSEHASILSLAQSCGDKIEGGNRTMVSLVWNDPGTLKGVQANEKRGGGCRWGPDVTNAVCAKHNLSLIIRSHECQIEGSSYSHDGKVLTIFSASNYYSQSSNLGAYIKLTDQLPPQIIQYICTKHFQAAPRTLKEKVGAVERAALRELGEEVIKNKTAILAACQKRDHKKNGELTVSDWVAAMEEGSGLPGIPWRSIAPRFVKQAGRNNYVVYSSCLDRFSVESHIGAGEADVRVLYRNLGQLEYIFRLLDTDHSGCLSTAEFRKAYQVMRQFEPASFDVSDAAADSFLAAMDLDKNGRVDFNEFVESFRLVHTAAQSHTASTAKA